MSTVLDGTPRYGDLWVDLPGPKRYISLVGVATRISLVAIPFVIILLLGTFVAVLNSMNGPRSRIQRSIEERHGTDTTKR